MKLINSHLLFLILIIIVLSSQSIQPVFNMEQTNIYSKEVPIPLTAATTYYVATTGDDGDPGTIGQPWRTIQKAFNTLLAGDTCYIRVGNYTGVYYGTKAQGTAASPILVENYNNEKVWINQTHVGVPGDDFGLILLHKQRHLTIRGIIFENSSKFGLLLLEDGHEVHNITIDNCTFRNCSASAIRMWGATEMQDITVKDCILYDIENNHSGLIDQEGISLSNINRFAIYNNTIYDCHKNCIDAKSGSQNGLIYNNTINTTHDNSVTTFYQGGGIYTDAYNLIVSNISIYNNIIYGNKTGIHVGLELGGIADNITIYNNLINTTGGNDFYAIVIDDMPGAGSNPGGLQDNVSVFHNTIFGSNYSIGIINGDANIRNLAIQNNIIDCSGVGQKGIVQSYATSNHTITHNLFNVSNSDVWGSNSINASPQFVDDSTFDFHLYNSSPAVNSGTNVGITTDFDGRTRPISSFYDRGAYEYYPSLLIVQTLDVVDVEETSATFGSYLIDGLGVECRVWFEYGTDISYGTIIPDEGEYIDTFDLTPANADPFGIGNDDTYIWVADISNAEVYRYTMSGTYTGTHWDTDGMGADTPYGLCTNGNRIYIVDEADGWVGEFTMGGTPFGYPAFNPGANSYGITMNDTYFWITNNVAAEVYLWGIGFGATGINWDTAASGNADPQGIGNDDTYIWIADDTDNEIYKYQMDGTYVSSFDTAASGNTDPLGVTTNGTYIWVIDGVDKDTYIYYAYRGMNRSTGEYFNLSIDSLTSGQIYYYRAVANSSGTTIGYGLQDVFLTKPNVVTIGYANTTNLTDINVSWTKADGANNTYIERNTVSSWSRGIGTLVYNDTGTYYFDNSTGENPLEQDTTYYYRLWSYANWTYNPTIYQWADTSLLLSNTTLEVDPPYNGSRDYDGGTNTVNITWTRGNYSDQELVVKRNDTYATSPTQSGNWVRQNNTYTYFNESATAGGYYTVWSWNETDRIYSLTGLNIPWGALYIGCFNESNMSEFITFDIEITDSEAQETYIQEDVATWLHLDIYDIPYGDDTIFIFSASGYRQRTYYYDLVFNELYNITAYLPPIETPAPPGGEGEDCQLLLYSDSVSVTNPAVDATITLTHDLEEIVTVDIYNSSLYGTYGGWIVVPNSNFTYSSTQVVVNSSVLDVNTTMARATYYYEHCGDITSILCQITVKDEISNPIPNVKCTTQRLNNITEEYVNISIDYTDGNGQYSIWLIPNVNYRFVLNKTGYIQTGSKFWTPTTVLYTKTFMLEFVEPDFENISGNWWEDITFEGYINNVTNTLYVNYTDSLNQTINVSFIVYELNTSTGTIVYTAIYWYNSTTNDTFQFNTTVNSSNVHKVTMWLNHTLHGYIVHTITLTPPGMEDRDITTPDRFNTLFTANYGTSPGGFGWSNIVAFFIILAGFFAFGQQGAGLSLIGTGFMLLFINVVIGMIVIAIAVPVIFIILGILVEWRNRQKGATLG